MYVKKIPRWIANIPSGKKLNKGEAVVQILDLHHNNPQKNTVQQIRAAINLHLQLFSTHNSPEFDRRETRL